MSIERPQPALPLPAVRDAIGLVRLLYVAEANEGRQRQIAGAGESLSTALRMAQLEDPDCLGYKAAPGNAAKGFAALLAMTWPPDVEALIRAAQGRVGRTRPSLLKRDCDAFPRVRVRAAGRRALSEDEKPLPPPP
jgi:hypothetical protein